MNRGAYLIPRLVILTLIAIAVWLGKDPLIRFAIVHHIQHLTGAKVEIGQLRSTLGSGRLFVKELKITDPRDPMTNFLQADLALLNLDFGQLSHQNLVIEDGQVNGLVFHAPRTESGSLVPSRLPIENRSDSFAPNDCEEHLQRLGQRWLEHVQPLPSTDEVLPFETLNLSNEMRQRWQQQVAVYSERIKSLQPQLDQLRKSLESEYQNPLRDLVRYEQAATDLQQLEQQAIELRSELNKELLQLTQEKQQLHAAKSRDDSLLQHQSRTNDFDSNLISELLLYRAQSKLVGEVVDLISWFRNTLPDPRELANYQQQLHGSRGGVDVEFPGVVLPPELLVKRLTLEGEGRFANQHLNFVGTAFDLSTQPHRHPVPANFELRAQGKQHLIVKCEIDRRTGSPTDKFQLQCPDIELPPQTLGHLNSLLVSLGPNSRINADIEILVDGDQLSGTLLFNYSNVALHVDKLNELAGGAETALHINKDLLQINDFKTTTKLRGSLEKYAFDLQSDLGSQFAATVDRVVIGHFQQQTAQQQTRLNEILAAEIQNLEQVVEPALEKLASKLQQDVKRIADLKATLDAPLNQAWPKIR